MKTKRLFFAIWPRDSERREIDSATRNHVDISRGRPTKLSNLHVTLAFLGSIPADRVGNVEAAAGLVRSAPFVLSLESLQYWKRPGILALCAEPTPVELAELVHGLWRGLEPCGFTSDPRPFKAHVTLARRAERRPPLDDSFRVAWKVDDFVLAESVTDPEGACYKVLRCWPLARR